MFRPCKYYLFIRHRQYHYSKFSKMIAGKFPEKNNHKKPGMIRLNYFRNSDRQTEKCNELEKVY